jgi:hypothetical protein
MVAGGMVSSSGRLLVKASGGGGICRCDGGAGLANTKNVSEIGNKPTLTKRWAAGWRCSISTMTGEGHFPGEPDLIPGGGFAQPASYLFRNNRDGTFTDARRPD